MLKKIDYNNMPNHIAIIMDGNGRWAKKRFLPRLMGHKAGCEAFKKVIKAGCDLGIKIMSFYAFSTENWKRSKDEVTGIFNLVRDYLSKYAENLNKLNIKLQTMGDISKLPEDLYKVLLDLTEKTKNNTGLIMNLGLNYGGRDEITHAVNNLIKSGKKVVTSKDIHDELYTKNLTDPDLIVRAGGEQRLSNFMLYQLAYSELYFPKTYWPDFDEKMLKKAIIEYQSRDRRFGNVK